MMGSMVNVTIRKKAGPGILHFGFPLWAVWIFLLPLAVLISPSILVICLLRLIAPWRVISIFRGIIRALKGAEVEIDDRSRLVAIGIR
ncbi:MAG TPA: hypothetical protein VIX89_06465 [Bryobacteraceae bacterium]